MAGSDIYRLRASPRQKGNPVLDQMDSRVVTEFDSSVKADFIVGATACVLFLQLKYHALHPEYIYKRIQLLGRDFELRVLLLDAEGVENPADAVRDLTKAAYLYDLTVVVASTHREAADWLAQLRIQENSTTESLEGVRVAKHGEQFLHAATRARTVNKTDAVELGKRFGTFREVLRNSEPLEALPGWGKTKSDSFLRAVRDPVHGPAAATKEQAKAAATKEQTRLTQLARPTNPDGEAGQKGALSAAAAAAAAAEAPTGPAGPTGTAAVGPAAGRVPPA